MSGVARLTATWDDYRVLVALGTLAANTFLQPQSDFSEIWPIDPDTWRWVRLLPFLGVVDVIGNFACTLALCCDLSSSHFTSVYQSLKQGKFWRRDDDKYDRVGKKSSVWKDSMFVAVLLSKPFLALIAGVQLIYLTWCDGSTFTCLCGWVLYTSATLNMITSRSKTPMARTLDPPLPSRSTTANTGSTDAPEAAESKQTGTQQFYMVAIAFALVLQTVHVAWLCQYPVPRTLWMDWGRKVIAEADHSNITFIVPPGMPPPTPHQVFLGNTTLGFWPSHTVSGSIFYSIDIMAMSIVMSFLSTFLIAMPWFIITYGIWGIILFTISSACYYSYLAIHRRLSNLYDRHEHTNVVQGTLSMLDSGSRKFASLPEWAKKVLTYPCYGLFFLVLFPSGAAVFMAPVMLLSWGFIPIDPFNILTGSAAIKFYLNAVDLPQGSYASLTGTIFIATIIVLRRGVLPNVYRKPRAELSVDEKRYGTAIWTTLVVVVTTILYYLCYSHDINYIKD